MNEFESKIREVLSNALPAMQVETVCEQLKRLPQLEKELAETKNSLKLFQDSNFEKSNTISGLEAIIAEWESKEESIKVREQAIKEKELDLETRERNIKLELANLRLELEVKRNDDLYNLTSQVFHSPMFKQSGFTSIVDNYGNQRNIPFEQVTHQADQNIPMHRHALAPDANLKGSTEIPIK